MSVGGKCRHGFVRIWHVLDKSARWSLGISWGWKWNDVQHRKYDSM